MKLEYVVVTKESLEGNDEYDVIYSNIRFLNSLFENHIYEHEMCIEALESYYVDYYFCQFQNGGFSQFVYNSRWDSRIINHIRSGLKSMGAHKNLELFNKSAKLLDELTEDERNRFFDGGYFGENDERDFLDEHDEIFPVLQERESILSLNASWLKGLPNFQPTPQARVGDDVVAIVSSIPDLDRRIAAALEAEPRYKKIIRALCKAASQELVRLTASDLVLKGWGMAQSFHFITNQGHHHMVEANEQAIMYKGHTDEVVTIIRIDNELGSK